MKKIGQTLALLLLVLALLPIYACNTDVEQSSKYEIECALDGNTLTGKEVFTYFNNTDNSFLNLKFNLFGNAFRKDAKYSPISAQYLANAYPHGISYGETSITSVTQDGKALNFVICGEDMNILSVELLEEVFPDESVTLTIEFTLVLADVIARTGINDKTINLANFYPILCGIGDDGGFYECVYYSSGDPFYSDCADYNVTLTYDSEYVVASSGKLISSQQNGEKSTSVYSQYDARSFCFVLSKEFESVTQDLNGVSVNYYYYKDKSPEKSLEYAVKSIELFGNKFGKYPYENFSVVQTKFVQGGMEFPGLVMISDQLSQLESGEVIVHETAHQWWQSAVGNNEIEYGFLDEGLTEYSVVVFFENYPEYGYTRDNMIKASEQTYKTFCSVYEKLFGNTDTTMIRSLKNFSSEYEYVNIAYIKSCIMYDTIRKSVGDKTFFKSLQKYFSDYCFKNATPYDLVGAFEKNGANVNGIFESFFDGKVII